MLEETPKTTETSFIFPPKYDAVIDALEQIPQEQKLKLLSLQAALDVLNRQILSTSTEEPKPTIDGTSAIGTHLETARRELLLSKALLPAEILAEIQKYLTSVYRYWQSLIKQEEIHHEPFINPETK